VPAPGNPQSLNRYSYVLNNPLRYTDPSGHFSEEEIQKYFGAKDWADFRQKYGDRLYELMNSDLTWGDLIAASNGDLADVLIMFGFNQVSNGSTSSFSASISLIKQNSDGTLSESGSLFGGLSELADMLQQYDNAAVYRTDLRLRNDDFRRVNGLGWNTPPIFSAKGGRAGYQMGFYYNLDFSRVAPDVIISGAGGATFVGGLMTAPTPVGPPLMIIGGLATVGGFADLAWTLLVDGNAYDGVYPVFHANSHPSSALRRIGIQAP